MPARRTGDDGFSLVEVLVAMAIVSGVMLSLTSFFVVTLRVVQQQGNRQVAIQAAEDAMERARAIQVSAILTGRDADSSDKQRTDAVDTSSANYVPGVKNVLFAGGSTANGVVPYDKTAAVGAGAKAALPTSPKKLTVNGTGYAQYWFVEVCYRTSDTADTAGGDAPCTSTTAAPTDTSTYIPMYRLVVAVTWPDRQCAYQRCSYLTYSMIGQKSDEPIFNTSVPQIAPPGNLANDVGLLVNYVFYATGGTDTRTWTATGLPTGLVMAATTGIVTGTPTTVAGYTVTVTVVDSLANKDTVTFTWTINKLPALTDPGSISTPGGVAVSRSFTLSGGSSPYVWSVTDLPTGLTMDTSTGTVTGTPTATGTYAVVLTVKDKYSMSSSVSFTWTVPTLAIGSVAVQTFKSGTAITAIQLTASGGIQPYVSWAAAGLPTGLSIDTATGQITGTPTVLVAATLVTFTVTDTAGVASSTTALWTVTL